MHMTNSTYRGAVLFDLDGTLVDTAADFVQVIRQMFAEENLTAPDACLIRNTVSEGARGLIRTCWQLDETDPQFEIKRQRLLDLYEQQLGNHAALFNGFDQMLTQLQQHNIAWGVVTNKPWRFSEPLMQKLNLTPSNGVLICPDHVKNTKPDAEPLLLAASRLQLTPEQCVYAGDHLRDIQAAKNAGMFSIACAFGYIRDDDNIHDWQADIIVDDVAAFNRFVHHHFMMTSHD